MRLNQNSNPVESHGLREAARYANIEMNATAFEVLSSSIYTDKPLAVLRELCANALDAHKEAGQDRPFEVVLPSPLNPELIVRDFGIGLSHEAVVELYMTYFGSSKRSTDELIGGFGLGSKSPLAYTDSFVVVSTYQGHKRTYSVYKDGAGMPAVQLLEDERIVAHNGLEVRMPVSSPDFHRFRDTTKHLLAYFPPGSVVCLSHPDVVQPVQYATKGTKWALRTSGPFSGPRAVVGPVSYKLDYYSIDEFPYSLRHKDYDFFFDIGEVSVAVSRESLQFDKRTQVAVIERAKQVISEEAQAYINSYHAATNRYERILALSNANFADMTTATGVEELVQQEREKETPYSFVQIYRSNNANAPFGTRVYPLFSRYFRSDSLARAVGQAKKETPRFVQPTFIFLHDNEGLKSSMVNFVMQNPELEEIINSPLGLVMVRSGEGKTIDDFRKEFHPNCISLTDLSNERAVPRRRKTSSSNERAKSKGVRNPYEARHFSTFDFAKNGGIITYPMKDDLDPAGKYVFITLEKFKAIGNKQMKQALLLNKPFRDTVIDGAKVICIPTKVPMYVQRMVAQHHPLDYYINHISTQMLSDPDYQRARQALARFESGKARCILPKACDYSCDAVLDRLPDGPGKRRFKRMVKQHHALRHRMGTLEGKYSYHLAFDKPLPEPDRPATFPERWAAFYQTHPLFYLAAGGAFDPHALRSHNYYSYRKVHPAALMAAFEQENSYA